MLYLYYRDDTSSPKVGNLRTKAGSCRGEYAQQEAAEENTEKESQSCNDQTENNSLNTDNISDETNHEHKTMLEEIQRESEINSEPNENELTRHLTNLQQSGEKQLWGLSQDDSDSDNSIVIMDHPHGVIGQQETVDDEIKQAQSDDDGIYIIDSPQQTDEQDDSSEGELKQISKKRMKVTSSKSNILSLHQTRSNHCFD